MRLASAGPFLFPVCALVMCVLVSCATDAPVDDPRAAGAAAHTGGRAAQPASIAPGVRVDRAQQAVTVEGMVVLNQGFLEQLVCTPGTRVHESLIAIDAAPRELHAALLLAGLEPGAPGRWQEVADAAGEWSVERVRPTGPRLDVSVRWHAPDGTAHEQPILEWVRRANAPGDPSAPSHGAAGMSPPGHLVFAGSRIRTNTRSMGPGEHYVADFTGSVIGLVTFGDEVIAYDEVIADRVDVDPAVWEAWSERMPPEGTRVELLIRAHRSGR
ncbi:MAG: hypothetical protein FGM37_06185 [Phycisphaerales bacterium]|nr:hypothetical protein [Phycisphaerales bacterium]